MKKIICLGIIIMMLLGVCGCGTGIIFKTGSDPVYILQLGENKVELADVKTILLEYKEVYNQYKEEFDEKINWEEDLENQLLYHYVLDEVIIIEVLQMLAIEHNISLTSAEEEKVVQAGTAYMEQLHDDEKAYCYATLEQAQNLMRKYVLAEKTIAYLTSNQNWEVSENEARAITVQIMEFASKALAENALEQLELGTVFQQVYIDLLGESPKDYTIVRGDLIPSLETELYLLKSGEYTTIIEDNGIYFIAYCVNDYLPDLTQANRLEIQNQKKEAYWMPIVEEKRNTLNLYLDEKRMEEEAFGYDQLEASFYNIYRKYFGE